MEFTLEAKQKRDLIFKMAKKNDIDMEISTVNNIIGLVQYLVELGNDFTHIFNNDSDSIAIMQTEIGAALGLCQSSVSDLLRKAKQIGVLTTTIIAPHAWRIARNAYTLIDCAVVKAVKEAIKRFSNKHLEKDSREAIAEAIAKERKNYEGSIDSRALDLADQKTLEHCKLVKAIPANSKGEGYYAMAVRDAVIHFKNIDGINAMEVNSPQIKYGSYSGYKKPTIDSFNNFEQRSYDFDDLEKKLLGWSNVEESTEEQDE